MGERINILGVVPARAGSKGLPGKNIRLLLGKPLISWMIEAASRSQYITRLIFSSDSDEYMAIARQFGAETPFRRPPEFASDTATDIQVLTHTVRWLEQHEGYSPDIILRLQPTNPTFPTRLIDAGIELLLQNLDADSARPITPTPKHPYKMWRVKGDGITIEPFFSESVTGMQEPFNMGRQQLPAAYVQVGAMEVLRYQTLVAKCSMAGKHVRYLLVSDPLETINIDTELDFLLAELALQRKQESAKHNMLR